MTSLGLATEGLLDRGSNPTLAIATLGYLRSGAAPPTPSTGTSGGGGAHRWRSATAEEQRRYRAYARRLVAKKVRADEDETSELELAWNRAHGIDLPPADELPASVVAVVDRIKAIPKRQSVEREVLIDRLVAMLADLRLGVAAEQERLEAEELEEAAIVALSMWP